MANENSSSDPQELNDLGQVGSETAEQLRAAGYETVGDVRNASVDELADVDGIGKSQASELEKRANDVGGDGADEDDTIESEGAGESETADEDDEAGEADAANQEASTAEDEDTEGSDDPDDTQSPQREEADAGDLDVMTVRDTVTDVVPTLIDDPFDGIVEVDRNDSGWYASVEVVERSAVPDTQDILGRYEIDLDGSGSVTSYRLLDRYRRGDVSS